MDIKQIDNQELNEAKSQANKFLFEGAYYFKTLPEAKIVANYLSILCPNPASTMIGLMEIFINAIEHGNLEIGYAQKTKLQEENKWDIEIANRLTQSPYKDRKVKVQISYHNNPKNMDNQYSNSFNLKKENLDNKLYQIIFTVTDEGSGFDYSQVKHYQQQQNHAISNTSTTNKNQNKDSIDELPIRQHGFGIIMAKSISFSKLEYISPGNIVKCYINLD